MLSNGLDFVERYRRSRELQLEETAQRRALARLVVHCLGVVLIDLELAASRRVLELDKRCPG